MNRMTAKEFNALLKNRNRPVVRMQPACIIGIDPGTETGVCVINKFNDNLVTKTLDFWEAYFFVTEQPKETTLVICENGGLIAHSFNRADLKVRERLIAETGQGNETAERHAQDRASRNIGAANQEAKLLISGLARSGFFVLQVKPAKQKWSHQDQVDFTGITARHNQHVRDAIRLAWEHRHIFRVRNLEARLGQVL